MRGAAIDSFKAWLGHSEAGLKAGSLRCEVPANDVRIYRLLAGETVPRSAVREGGLGYGVPEVDLDGCAGRQRSRY